MVSISNFSSVRCWILHQIINSFTVFLSIVLMLKLGWYLKFFFFLFNCFATLYNIRYSLQVINNFFMSNNFFVLFVKFLLIFYITKFFILLLKFLLFFYVSQFFILLLKFLLIGYITQFLILLFSFLLISYVIQFFALLFIFFISINSFY